MIATPKQSLENGIDTGYLVITAQTIFAAVVGDDEPGDLSPFEPGYLAACHHVLNRYFESVDVEDYEWNINQLAQELFNAYRMGHKLPEELLDMAPENKQAAGWRAVARWLPFACFADNRSDAAAGVSRMIERERRGSVHE